MATLPAGQYLDTYTEPQSYIRDATGAIIGFEDSAGNIHYTVESKTNPLTGVNELSIAGGRSAPSSFARCARNVLLAGDSFNANGGLPISQSNKGALSWANFYSGFKYNFVANIAIGGTNIRDEASRFASELVANPSANEVWLTCGINSLTGYMSGGATDPHGVYSLSEMIADATKILVTAISSGVTLRWFNICPPSSGYSWTPSVGMPKLVQFNAWLTAQQAIFSNLVVVDAYSVTVTCADSNGYGQAQYYVSDKLHPNAKLAQLLGWLVYQSDIGSIYGGRPLPASQGEGVASLSQTGLLDNYSAWFLGNTAGVGSGWSVQVSGTATQTASIVAEPNGFGNMQRSVMSGGASGGTVTWTRWFSSPPINNSDTIIAQAGLHIADGATGLKNTKCTLSLADNASATVFANFLNGSSDDVVLTASAAMPYAGIMQTQPVTPPPGSGTPSVVTAAMYLFFDLAASGSATADIYRAGMRKI